MKTAHTGKTLGATFLILVMVASAGGGDGDDDTTARKIDYEVTRVKRKLMRELDGGGEERLAAGARLSSGDILQTGWMSSAEIAAPLWATRFALGPRTRVRLAHEVPGVLLEVERGRLRATFDPLPESETDAGERERIVTTPSVVLAVRGTEYGIEVDGDGDTTVVVFEGAVEAMDATGEGEPVRIGPGLACSFRRGRGGGAQWRHGLGTGDWDRGASAHRHRHRGGATAPTGGMGGVGSGGTGNSPMGGAGSGGRGSSGQGQQRGGGGSSRHGG